MTYLLLLLRRLVALYSAEPARVNAWVAGIIVAVAVRIGLHVDGTTILAVVGFVLHAVVGELTRAKVTPAVAATPGPDVDGQGDLAASDGGVDPEPDVDLSGV